MLAGNNLEDYKLAPFHILATEYKVWTDKNHEWHMENIRSVCLEDPSLLLSTNYKIIDLNDEASTKEACEGWLNITENGGEGMVIKPYDYIQKGKKGLIQPAVKIRGREYLNVHLVFWRWKVKLLIQGCNPSNRPVQQQ